ncbi:MAG: aldo/keto reductase [Spirochaetaceae bacterium]|nr:aldo/keto reductase [Spirochaetaceae bacterium]
MMYNADDSRYEKMTYNRCGKSGLKLPKVSLGFWHNFGSKDIFDNMVAMCRTAFDNGITHFDLANNYGPVPGSAEENLGKILKQDFLPYRDELVISSKAGYGMWPGPYGDWGSKKYLIASCDQSLKRTGLEYFDIFYHHRFDPETPLEETMEALNQIVKSGKALYAGISNYNKEQTESAQKILKSMNCPFIINQRKYSILNRDIETDGLKDFAGKNGVGIIAFCPLAQGLLTDKYLNGIPENSRVKTSGIFLKEKDITPELVAKLKSLNEVAASRGETLAQMSLAWVLRDSDVTSVLIGASRPEQIIENCKIVDAKPFTQDELSKIDEICKN